MAKLIDITGKAISGEWGTDDLVGNGVPVLRTTNFTNIGVVNFNNVVTRQIVKKSISEKLLRYGDIIIEKSGGSDKQPVGRVVFFEGENNKYLFNNFTGLLRVRDFCKWNPKYIFYSLFSNYANGGTIPFENRTTGLHNLQTDSYVNSVMIVERKIEEQTDIVTILDKVNQLINYEKKQLEDLDILVKSRFVELFLQANESFPKKKLGECTVINPKKSMDTRLKEDLIVSFVPMASVGEDGSIDTSEKKLYREVKSGFTYFIEEDVLFAKITPCMENGKGAVAINLYNGIGFGSTEFHVIRPLEGFTNPVWLYNLSVSKKFRLEAEANMTGSAGQKRTPASFLQNYEIKLPPIELQNQFADFAEQVDKSKLAIQQSLDELETLKKSLMQQYFG